GCSALSWEREKHSSPASEKTQHSLNNSQLNSLQHTHLLANRLDLPFMMMPHPLLPVGLPPASVAMAMNQMNHLNTIANMVASAQVHSPVSRPTSAIKQECFEESPSLTPSVEGIVPQKTEPSPQLSSSFPSSPTHPYTHSPQKTAYDVHDEQREIDSALHMNRLSNNKVEQNTVKPKLFEKVPAQTFPTGFPASLLFTDGLSSVETLLTNVQGLLKVALENARLQEKQLQQERRELKMELYREREMRESLERQLTSELRSRATIQRRLKKEKKAKRRLQEALEFESKRRGQIEQALQQATSSDPLTHDPISLDMETERCRSPEDNCLLQGGELPREAEEVLHIMDHPHTKNNQLPECSFQGREDFKVLHNEHLTQSSAPSTLIPILTTFQIPQLLFIHILCLIPRLSSVETVDVLLLVLKP
ncbi:dachshund, partial [Pimephales promelas]